jgi:hypothetical protein
VLASIQVVELRLGNRVIDIYGREKEASLLLHLIQTVNTSSGFLRNSLASFGNLVPFVGLAGLEKSPNDAEDNLELLIVGRARVGKSSILQECILGLFSLMNEKSHVSTVINNEIRSMAFAIILRPGKGAQSAFPVLLERLSFPGEHGSTLIASDGSGSVILRGKDVARAPTNVATDLLQSLDENGCLDCHVEGSGDACTGKGLPLFVFLYAVHEPRHFNLGNFNLLAAIVGKGDVSNCAIENE